MPTTASSIPKSPTRLPTAGNSLPATSMKQRPASLSVAAATAGPKSPTNLGKSNSHIRSPSKLPKSPGLKSPSSSSAQPSNQRCFGGKPTHPTKNVGVPTATRSPTAGNSSTTRSKSTIASQALKPNIRMTPSPPHSPKKPTPQRTGSAASASQITKPLALTPKDPSPYIAAHVGEPCTLKSLDHRLGCGHKIITTQPESCASNCQTSNSSHANPRSLDRPFACLACVVSEQQTKHTERVSSFKEELQQVAKATKKPDSERWIEAKVALMEQAWRDLENEDMAAAAREGRFCYPVYVNQESQSAMVAVVGARLREKARKQVEDAAAVAKNSV